jgi:ABC-type transporter Mla MlaB component
MEELAVGTHQMRDRGVALVLVSGELRMDNRHVLWGAVRKAIAECPRAVVVDLSQARLVEDAAVTVFARLRRGAAAHGPGVALELCGATESLAEHLVEYAREGPLHRDRLDAFRAIATSGDGRSWLARRIAPDPAAVRLAATLVADTCALWGMPELIPSSRRAVTDLVRVARWCPPRELFVTMSHRGRELVLGVRGLMSGAHEPWCPPQQRLPEGCHHLRTELGHISWMALKTAAVPAYDPSWRPRLDT